MLRRKNAESVPTREVSVAAAIPGFLKMQSHPFPSLAKKEGWFLANLSKAQKDRRQNIGRPLAIPSTSFDF